MRMLIEGGHREEMLEYIVSVFGLKKANVSYLRSATKVEGTSLSVMGQMDWCCRDS